MGAASGLPMPKLPVRQVVDEAGLPLSEAEAHLYTALHLSVMAYEDEFRLGHPPMERRCLICEKRMSGCYC